MADGIQIGAVSAPHPTRTRTDNYLLATDGTITWLEGAAERSEPAGGAGSLLVVSSGFGKEPLVAATTAVRVMAKLYRPGLPRDPARAMLDFVIRAHRKLRARAREAGPIEMGASLTLAWFLEGKVHWVQVGNTRLYQVRHDRFIRLSPIHDRREFLMRDGQTDVGPAEPLVQGFLWGSDGLGDDAELRLERGLDAGTEYLEPGDRFILCSPGISDAVDDVSMANVLRNVPDAQHASVSLAERAFARGGRAHASAIVVKVNRIPAKTLSAVRQGSGKTFY